MKKLLVIFMSVMCLGLWAQDEAVSELTPATAPDGDDLLYFVEDGSSTSITKDLLQESVTDSLAAHLVRIIDLETGGASYWVRVGTRLLPLNAGDGVLMPSGDSLLFGNGTAWIMEQGPGNTLNFGADNVDVARFDSDKADFFGDIQLSQGNAFQSHDTNTEIWEDGSGNWNFKDAIAGTHTLSELSTAGRSKLISYTSCPANTTTNIIIGSTTTDVAFTMEYVAERNTEPDIQKITGEIRVLYDDVGSFVSYFSDFIPDYIDLGMSITANLSGSDIRLNIIVDNSNSNTLSFDYSITHKFYE